MRGAKIRGPEKSFKKLRLQADKKTRKFRLELDQKCEI